ncbi:hypothetical protein M9H77_21285 [Catharanthus roseus]|uniref:Uncharacterized protein n=1 Tax=Catharanthus roseus TaxID=4058 RepID=A0ACC0ALU5_CATRO|nr:hypothetical protein M9H77_21285 [Catharanthus roseus]
MSYITYPDTKRQKIDWWAILKSRPRVFDVPVVEVVFQEDVGIVETSLVDHRIEDIGPLTHDTSRLRFDPPSQKKHFSQSRNDEGPDVFGLSYLSLSHLLHRLGPRYPSLSHLLHRSGTLLPMPGHLGLRHCRPLFSPSIPLVDLSYLLLELQRLSLYSQRPSHPKQLSTCLRLASKSHHGYLRTYMMRRLLGDDFSYEKLYEKFTFIEKRTRRRASSQRSDLTSSGKSGNESGRGGLAARITSSMSEQLRTSVLWNLILHQYYLSNHLLNGGCLISR